MKYILIAFVVSLSGCNPFTICQGDCKNGHGTRKWILNGLSCEADFVDGVPVRNGVIIAPKLGRYVGEISPDCLAHGEGQITFHNGDKAIGKWYNGVLHGSAKYKTADGVEDTVVYDNGKVKLPR